MKRIIAFLILLPMIALFIIFGYPRRTAIVLFSVVMGSICLSAGSYLFGQERGRQEVKESIKRYLVERQESLSKEFSGKYLRMQIDLKRGKE